MGCPVVKLLLDTHVWVWSHVSPERFSKRAAAALLSPKNELWLSPVSIWEFEVLAARGRLRINSGATASGWVREALQRVPLRDAALTREAVLRCPDVRLDHDDPADRFLAATAAHHDLTLVTADERLLAGRGFKTMDCR